MPETDPIADASNAGDPSALELPSFDTNPSDMGALDRLEELHRTIDALEALIVEETALVRVGSLAEVAALQVRKSQTAALYQTQATQLLAEADFLRGSDNPFRAQLAERTQALRQVMTDNRTALNAAKASRFHRIEAVMEAMREQVAEESLYTPDGGLASNRPRRKPVLTRSFNAKI